MRRLLIARLQFRKARSAYFKQLRGTAVIVWFVAVIFFKMSQTSRTMLCQCYSSIDGAFWFRDKAHLKFLKRPFSYVWPGCKNITWLTVVTFVSMNLSSFCRAWSKQQQSLTTAKSTLYCLRVNTVVCNSRDATGSVRVSCHIHIRRGVWLSVVILACLSTYFCL